MDGGVGVKDIKAAMQTFDVFHLNIYTSLKVFSKIFPNLLHDYCSERLATASS